MKKTNLIKELKKGGYTLKLCSLIEDGQDNLDCFNFSIKNDITIADQIKKIFIFKSLKENRIENNCYAENIGNENYKISKFYRKFVVDYFYDNHYKYVYKINIKSYERNKKISLIRFDDSKKFKKFIEKN